MKKLAKSPKKGKKKSLKLTEKQQRALELRAEYPSKSNHAIGLMMQVEGYDNEANFLTKTEKKRPDIKAITAALQEKGQLGFTRLIPKTLKGIRFHLDKDEPPIKALDIAAKYGLGRPDDTVIRQPTIPINILINLSQTTLNQCQDRLEAIEVKESGKDDKG